MKRGSMYMPILALLLVVLPQGIEAQTPLRVPTGTRLRVTSGTSPDTVQIGRLEAVSDSALVLYSAGATRTIPLETIRRLEASRGRPPNAVAGVVGLLLGVAVGGVLGCAVNRDDYGVLCAGQSDTKVALGAAIGGVGGAAFGTFVFRRELWRGVDFRERGANPP
jgi:hypothetical protein